jgi:hypothetical protein
MKECAKVATHLEMFHRIFLSIAESARKPISTIAKNVGHEGRGKRRSTIASYLKMMYECKISLLPCLVLKTFEAPKRKAYFLKKKDKSLFYKTFEALSQRANYTLFLSGDCDYYATSREKIDFDAFDVEIVRESFLYTPLFVKPFGWKNTFSEAIKKVENFNFKKGYLKRETKGILEWSDLDFKIFEKLKDNGRKKFTDVGKSIGVHSTTVKRHFFDTIVLDCEFVHFFFPKGYAYYNKAFFVIDSKYESSLIKAFTLLPCTTYVYPYEKMIGCIIFHRDMNALMTTMETLKIEGYIETFSMYTPLRYKKEKKKKIF